jgi:hypothetical protein
MIQTALTGLEPIANLRQRVRAGCEAVAAVEAKL